MNAAEEKQPVNNPKKQKPLKLIILRKTG